MTVLKAARRIMVSAVLIGLGACGPVTEEPFVVDSLTGNTNAPAAGANDEGYAIARNYLDQNQAGLALAQIERFLVANPRSAKGHALAGVIYDRVGRFDLAERHYKTALEIEPDSVPTKNNFALSKLQWAQASGRMSLATEAQALLAEAASADGSNEQVKQNQEEARRVISALETAQTQAAATAPPTNLAFSPIAWLERRAQNYTFVVTRMTPAIFEAISRLHLEPSVALVTPGATYLDRVQIAANGPPPILTIRTARLAKPRWYHGGGEADAGPSPAETLHVTARGFKARPAAPDVSPEELLNARVNRLLTVASLQ